jgi:type IV pilus assembly protein PilV
MGILAGTAKIDRTQSAQSQCGFSLLEVLIAAVIFALGLGGLSLMLITSVHGTLEARNETMASAQMSSLAELILLNPGSTGHYIEPLPQTVGGCAAAETCPGAAWATGNFAQWQFELEQNLANAKGLVCRDSSPDDGGATDSACDGGGRAVVKVFWEDPHHVNEPDRGLRRAVLPLPE